MSLGQADADLLLKTPKLFENEVVLEIPQTTNGHYEYNLISKNKREKFVFNYGRYGRDSLKLKYQTRAREVIILARLDISGRPHRNPPTEDFPVGEYIIGPHIHLYREGYDDKFAFPLEQVPEMSIKDINDGVEVLETFLYYCSVEKIPDIQVLL